MPPNDFQEPTGNRPEGVRPVSPQLTAVGARQGVISGRIVTVLIVSVTLAIVAMVVAFLLSG